MHSRILPLVLLFPVVAFGQARDEQPASSALERLQRKPTPALSILDLVPDLDTSKDVTVPVREALASEKAKGRTIFFPAGRYSFSGNILSLGADDNMGIVGEGIDRTLFRFTGQPKRPLIVTQGEELHKSPFNHQDWFTLDSLTINVADSVEVPAIEHRFTAHAYYQRVLFRGGKFGAVAGLSWWDSTFTECHWINCGDPETGMAAVHMRDGNKAGSDRCNNIVLDNCRFEVLPGTAIYLGSHATRNRIRSCKFDRVGLAIHLNGATCNTISDSQISGHEKQNGIKADQSRATVITSSHFDRLETAIEMKQCSGVVNDCTFGQQNPNSGNGINLGRDTFSKNAVKLGQNLPDLDTPALKPARTGSPK